MRSAICLCVFTIVFASANAGFLPDFVNIGLGKVMNNPLTGTYVKSSCKAYGYCNVAAECEATSWLSGLSDFAGNVYSKSVALAMTDQQKKDVCASSGYYTPDAAPPVVSPLGGEAI